MTLERVASDPIKVLTAIFCSSVVGLIHSLSRKEYRPG